MTNPLDLLPPTVLEASAQRNAPLASPVVLFGSTQPVVAPVAPVAPALGGRPMGQDVVQQQPGNLPTVAPISPQTTAPYTPTGPLPNQVSQTMAPVAYAMQNYKETGNPFTAAAEGLINATNYKQQVDLEKSKASQAASLLDGFPGIQKAVANRTLDLPSAVALANQKRDLNIVAQSREAAAKTAEANGDANSAALLRSGAMSPADYSQQFKPIEVSSFSQGMTVPATGQFTPFAGGTGSVDDIVKGMTTTDDKGIPLIPPEITGLPRNVATAVIAKLAQQGVSYTQMKENYAAAVARNRSLNTGKQLSLSQALDTTAKSLSLIDTLADQWKQQNGIPDQFKVLNAANIDAAIQGLEGTPAAKIATELRGQIQASTSEIGQVFKGGASPTDQALSSAAETLNSNWSTDVLHGMTDLMRQDMDKRRQAIVDSSVAPSVTGGANQYSPTNTQQVAPTPKYQPAASASPPTVSSQSDFDKLPSGTLYIEMGNDGQPHQFKKP